MRLNLPGPSSASAPYTTAQGGVADLDALRSTERNQTGGFPTLDEDGFVQDIHVSTSQSDTPVMLIGPTYGVKDETLTYKISNYNSWRTYTVTTSNGTVTRSGDTITLIPVVSSTTVVNLTVNGRVFAITVHGKEIIKPVLTVDNQGWTVNLSSSVFQTQFSNDTHTASRWQIAKDANFLQIVKDSGETSSLMGYSFTGFDLSTTYYVRLAHKGSTLGWSVWSDTRIFNTPFSANIRTPSITSQPDGVELSTVDPHTFTASDVIVDSSSLTWGTTLESVEWQLWRDASMATVLLTRTTATNSLVLTSAELGLGAGDTFYARVRQKGNNLPFSAWSALKTIKYGGLVAKPTIVSPTEGGVFYQNSAGTIQGSVYSSSGGISMSGSEWQFSTTTSFTEPAVVKAGTSVTYSVSTATLGTFYVRVRYKDTLGTYSEWSDPRKYVVQVQPASAGSIYFSSRATYNGAFIATNHSGASGNTGAFLGITMQIIQSSTGQVVTTTGPGGLTPSGVYFTQVTGLSAGSHTILGRADYQNATTNWSGSGGFTVAPSSAVFWVGQEYGLAGAVASNSVVGSITFNGQGWSNDPADPLAGYEMTVSPNLRYISDNSMGAVTSFVVNSNSYSWDYTGQRGRINFQCRLVTQSGRKSDPVYGFADI